MCMCSQLASSVFMSRKHWSTLTHSRQFTVRHCIFRSQSLHAENKTGFDGWDDFKHDCLLPHVLQPLKLSQTTSDSTCCSITETNLNCFASQHLIFWSVLITGKIILVCFCCTAQWGWDSLHPQINLEGPVLSAFYEENPPGDESWEYTLWQGRSCETGWFWPGWTFDGELRFHWAFHSLKVNIIKSGLPRRLWHMIIISVHSGYTAIKLTFLMQNKRLGAAELGSVYFHTVFAYILCPKNAVGQAALAKLLQPLVSFNLVRI